MERKRGTGQSGGWYLYGKFQYYYRLDQPCKPAGKHRERADCFRNRDIYTFLRSQPYCKSYQWQSTPCGAFYL